MTFANEQAAAGAEEPGHDTGPAADVGQPAQRADAGEDEVVAAGLQHRERVVDVGLDELDRCLRPLETRRFRAFRARGAEPPRAPAQTGPRRGRGGGGAGGGSGGGRGGRRAGGGGRGKPTPSHKKSGADPPTA